MNACVANLVPTDWRYIPGTKGYANTISVRGNVDWPITGYSIVGHIYLYSNQNFMTVTPTMTPTATFTPSPTATFTPTITPTPTVQDRWYTGNSQQSVYGVKADISAPSQKPYFVNLNESGESSYVTLAYTYWIQTGWHYYEGWIWPWSYVEGKNPVDGYYIDDRSIHNWGQTKEYKITWSGGTIWCAWIDGVNELCYGTQNTAPATVNAHSEVHVSPQNGLDTYFSNVYYMDSNNQWLLFNQARWREDSPYSVDKIQNSEYRNFGP